MGAQPEFESSLDRALQLATTDMVQWLVDDYQLEPWAAHLLVGSIGKYDVVTVQGTMALQGSEAVFAGALARRIHSMTFGGCACMRRGRTR